MKPSCKHPILNPLNPHFISGLFLSLFFIFLLAATTRYSNAQPTPAVSKPARFEQELQARLQSIVPQKIKLRGKPPIARWEEVDAVLAAMQQQLGVSALLREMISSDPGNPLPVLTGDQWNEVDKIFERHTLRYSQMFLIEKLESYFPLTNNILRYADDRTLADLLVYDRTAFSLGRYIGKYYYERTGGLVGGQGAYRLTFFQYRDNADFIRSCGNINLLDTFSVRWPAIKEQTGYLLHSSLFDPTR